MSSFGGDFPPFGGGGGKKAGARPPRQPVRGPFSGPRPKARGPFQAYKAFSGLFQFS